MPPSVPPIKRLISTIDELPFERQHDSFPCPEVRATTYARVALSIFSCPAILFHVEFFHNILHAKCMPLDQLQPFQMMRWGHRRGGAPFSIGVACFSRYSSSRYNSFNRDALALIPLPSIVYRHTHLLVKSASTAASIISPLMFLIRHGLYFTQEFMIIRLAFEIY